MCNDAGNCRSAIASDRSSGRDRDKFFGAVYILEERFIFIRSQGLDKYQRQYSSLASTHTRAVHDTRAPLEASDMGQLRGAGPV